MVSLILLVLLLPAASRAAEPPRFFVMGSGTLLVHGHTGERVEVRYRRADNTYDSDALRRLRQVFRSRGDDRETRLALRLVEVLSRVQQLADGTPLVLVSGYRSPDYNERIRVQGAKAAAGSLHTEGLAADIALPRSRLLGLWKQIRALDCCGVGYYAKEGFLHVDVGRPRFWEPATSKVAENLSASNARLFARTEFDRYDSGAEIVVMLHALTVPPVLVARQGHLVTDDRGSLPVVVGGDSVDGKDCITMAATGSSVRVSGVTSPARGRLTLAICEPRIGRTPATVESNPIEVR